MCKGLSLRVQWHGENRRIVYTPLYALFCVKIAVTPTEFFIPSKNCKSICNSRNTETVSPHLNNNCCKNSPITNRCASKYLPYLLKSEMSHQILLDELSEKLECSTRTIHHRLKQIMDEKLEITLNNLPHTLSNRNENNETVFFLNP